MVASPSLKGVWSGLRDTFYNFTPPQISLERQQLETSNFVQELSPSGRGHGHVSRDQCLHFGAQAISLEQIKVDIFKFGSQIECKDCRHYTR